MGLPCSPQLTFGLFALGCVGALAFVQCCLPETKGALHHDAHHGGHHGGHHVGPPTRCALQEAFDAGPGVPRQVSRESRDSCGGLRSSPSIDSDAEEWGGAVSRGGLAARSPLRAKPKSLF